MKPFNIPWRELKQKNHLMVMVSPDLIRALDDVDFYCGFRTVCHCLYDEERTPTNYHKQGLAADIHLDGLHPLEQYLYVEKLDLFGGIGLYGPDVWRHPGLHVDLRDRIVGARWAFRSTHKEARVQVALDKTYIKYLLEIMP